MSSPLLKPRWLVGHVLVVAVTVGFTFLGFWQLDRHFQQREENAVLADRLAASPIGLGDAASFVDAFEYRRVFVTGRYNYEAQLELRPRVRNGKVGYDQIVPLDTGDDFVLVNRGFIADAAGTARLVPGLDVEVVVTGTVRLSQGRTRFGPQNPETGVLTTIARIDTTRLDRQFPGGVYDAYLDLISEEPAPGGLATVPPAPPELTNRPNLLYALQWWAFAAIASIGWLFLLRKQFFNQ